MESMTRRALYRLTFWRLLAHILSIPEAIFECLAAIFGMIRDPILALEYHAARDYHTLTGVNLGSTTNDPYRYSFPGYDEVTGAAVEDEE